MGERPPIAGYCRILPRNGTYRKFKRQNSKFKIEKTAGRRSSQSLDKLGTGPFGVLRAGSFDKLRASQQKESDYLST
jgi:hypothetical protein